MINWNDALNDVIALIEPENVPIDYIVMAKYTDEHGVENTVRGVELKKFLTEKAIYFEAKIIVNVGKIKKAMVMKIVHFFNELDSKSTN